MLFTRVFTRSLAVLAVMGAAALPARADDLRNVKRGEPAPAFKLPTIDGKVADSEALKGSVLVVVCVSAEQRRSEMAAMDSEQVLKDLGAEPVKLVHITADVVQKAYFEKFRQERSIGAPLAFDADRAYYAKLGLIVLPTTIVINKEGRLDNVISLHSGEYKHTLDAYVRHALGTLSDDQLKERLAAHPSEESSPKSLASAHRALARSLREKGQLDAARDELGKALEKDADNREVMLDLADLQLATGRLDEADALIKKVLDAQPDHRRAKQLKGISLFRRDKLDEAEAVLTEALSLNPSPELAHYYLGRICEQKGQSAKALEHYREALKRFVHETEPGTPKPGTH